MALDDALQELILQTESENFNFTSWRQAVARVLNANFPKARGVQSNEGHHFLRSASKEEGIMLLKSYMGRPLSNGQTGTTITVTQTQTAIMQNNYSFQIMLNIDNAKELTEDQKQQVKELYRSVEAEVQKEKPNWEKVTGWLKDSLSYGLKIAPDIIKLAEMYYKAKT